MQFNEVSGEGGRFFFILFFFKVQSAIQKRVGGLSTIYFF